MLGFAGKVCADPDPIPPGEPEAPLALFDQKVSDVDVVLQADGTWTTRLATGWGEGITPSGVLPGLSYPGYERAPVFEQIPDFSLTLWLMERYYMEINYRIKNQSILLGYKGQPGEFVQWVKAGNAPFSVPARANQTLPEGRPGSPAAGAGFSAGPVDFEGLARYEDGTRQTRSFLGYRDISNTSVEADAWIHDQFFRLPAQAGPFTGIRILVEDPSGSIPESLPASALGTRTWFRPATAGEVSFNTATGEIILAAPAKKRYLVTWDGAAGLSPSYTSPLLGLKLTPNSPPVAGTWYVLDQPGQPSPFELRDRYPVPTGVTGAILLYNKDTGAPVTSVSVSQAPSQTWFQVSGFLASGAPDRSSSVAEAPFFYAQENGLLPFQTMYPSATAGSSPPATATLPWAFRLPATTNATSYSLGTDVIPSSIIVVRNGLTTSAFRFDETSGTLNLDVPVFDTDQIVISYQTVQTTNLANDLVLWQGGHWDLSDKQDMEWNFQSRWNMTPGSYTTEDLQSPGRIAGTLAWNASEGPWTWSLQGTGGAILADSTGMRQIYGQTDSGTQAALDGNALRPSAAPGTAASATSPLASLTEANRAPTFFSNYWINDPLTGTPNPGTYGTPGVTRQAAGSGGWMGPYIVLGDGQRTDRLAVLDADMSAKGQWSGLQVFVNGGKPADLRSTAAITIPIRVAVNTGTSTKIYFQAGTLSENFDGTGAIRAIQYQSLPSLAFFNQSQGVTQYFPIPENANWGNDGLGTGTTVPDGALLTHELTSSDTALSTALDPTRTDWQVLRLRLTAQERQLLQQATGWRLVVVDQQGGSQTRSRTILVGTVLFEGSTWSVQSQGSPTGSVNAAEQVDPTRASAHQLRVDWTGQGTTNSWVIQGRQNPVRPVSYGSIDFQYQWTTPPSPNTTMSFQMGDYHGQGMTVTWPVNSATSGWIKGKVNIKAQTVTFNGVTIPGATVKMTSGGLMTSWDRMFISEVGSDTGTLMISEVNAVDPQWEAVGNTVATTTWTQTAPWPSSDLPLITGMKVGITSNQDGLNDYDFTWIGQTTVAGNVGIIQETAEASYATSPQGKVTHGAYEATLPLVWPGGGPSLAWTDKFSDAGLRSERLVLGVPWVGTWDSLTKVSGPPLTLDQDYRLGWTSPSQWGDGWGAAASTEWNQTRAFIGTTGDFGNQWSESWKWLPPPPDTAPFYLLQAQATGQAPLTSFASAEPSVSTQVSQSIGPVVTWSPTGTWEWRFPLRFETERPFTLTPSVSKKSESVFSLGTPLDPSSSASQAAGWLWSQPGGLVSLPYSELRSASSIWSGAPQGLQSGDVQSTVGLDWERQTAQDWTDLAVPVTGGVQVTGLQGLEGMADYQSETVATHLEAKGLNLFGTLGSQPVFNWYRTDVWTWSLANTWSMGTRDQDQASTAALAARSELVLTPRESVALPVTFQGAWGPAPSETLGLKPSWTIKNPADLPFELPRWLSPSAFKRMWVQDLSAALNLAWQPTPEPVVRDLEIIWKGRFLLSEKSEMDFTTKWGQQWQTDLYVIGLEAAIDFILSF